MEESSCLTCYNIRKCTNIMKLVLTEQDPSSRDPRERSTYTVSIQTRQDINEEVGINSPEKPGKWQYKNART